MLAGAGWHPGVIGIVASRIVERHHRPAVLVALPGGAGDDGAAAAFGTGSGRSIPAFDLLAGLDACAEHLERHGGHRAAAGCTIAPDRVDAFRAAFERHAASVLAPEDLRPVERVDAVVGGGELGLGLAEELERLAPFGQGNPEVSLLVSAARLVDPRPMGEDKHVRFTVESGEARASAVAFGTPRLPAGAADGLDATFRLELNEYRGAVRPRLVLRQALAPRGGEIELVGEPATAYERALAELDAELEPSHCTGRDRRAGPRPPWPRPGRDAGRGRRIGRAGAGDRRRRAALGGGPGRPPRRLCRHVVAGAGARPVARRPYAHLVALDPPPTAAAQAVLDACSNDRLSHLAWGAAEVPFALGVHEHAYDLSEPLRGLYRALRGDPAAALEGDPGPRGAAAAGARRARAGRTRPRHAARGGRRRRAAHRARTLAGVLRLPQQPRGRRCVAEPRDPTGGVSKPIVRPGPLDRAPVGVAERPSVELPELAIAGDDLTPTERRLLADLFAIVEEHAGDAAMQIRREPVHDAFVFACEHHADQRRKSGEDFIVHPVGVAKICAGMRLDTETLVAALLHDTVEDTTASLDEVRERFGDEVAGLVDGVTKLTGITFQSRDEAQAENYRKMMVAMATDIRVILIKLADRLHNMRTIDALPKQKQIDKAKETLEIYAPIAHRLGIHAIKWELEDLAFASLHPRKYQEIKGLVNQQRDEREVYVNQAGEYLLSELGRARHRGGRSPGRAKHFYSIYSKMTKRGREFNEIYDLTAMRVIVDSVKDCYGAVGVVHSLWKPLPGRFKDFIAMPKFNMYQSLHTTVIGPEGRPLEIQIRTREMHDMAEFGVAAHWIYKQDPGATQPAAQDGDAKLHWLRSMLDWQNDLSDPDEFMETLKVDLFDEEVFVFTPKGEVKSLAAGATPLDFAYEVHTEIGHRCVGAKVNGKIVPLHYELKSGDIVEVLTAKRERGPSRDWLALVKTTRARNKIKQWFKQESRQDTEHTGRTLLQEALNKAGPAGAEDHRLAAAGRRDPRDGLPQGRRLLHRARRGEDLAQDRRQQGPAAPQAGRGGRGDRDGRPTSSSPRAASAASRPGRQRATGSRSRASTTSCCGWPSAAGRSRATRSSATSRSAAASRSTATTARTPRRCARTPSASSRCAGRATTRPRSRSSSRSTAGTATGCSRTSRARSPRPASTSSRPAASSSKPMVQNRFVVEVADTQTLKPTVGRLRNIDGVFDAYRVTPGGVGRRRRYDTTRSRRGSSEKRASACAPM